MGSPAYDKENTTRINLKLNNKTDADIIEKLRSVESIQGYIKNLIREDMKKMWYAVQRNPEDDWSTGSHNLETAKAMARKQLKDYPETLIAVIDEAENPVCIEEIRDFG